MTTVPQSSSCCGCCKSQPDSPITPTLLTPINTAGGLGGDFVPTTATTATTAATAATTAVAQQSLESSDAHLPLVIDTSIDALIHNTIIDSIAGGDCAPPCPPVLGGDIAPPATSDISHVNSEDTAPTDANGHAEKVRCITKAIFWLYFKLKRNKKHTTTP
jgi:hypothetical protein